MSQFGFEPFGVSPFGGPGVIAINGVIAIAANEILVEFSTIPDTADPFGRFSATNPRNWLLTPIDPTIESTNVAGLVFIPKGAVVPTFDPLLVRGEPDEDNDQQVHLFIDARMEARAIYELEILPAVRGDDCEGQAGPTAFRFSARRPGPALRARFVAEDRFRDWRNDPFPKDPDRLPSTWEITSARDFVLATNEESLRQRLLRRFLGAPGTFAHLPDHGAGLRVKALANTGELQRLANDLEAQANEEPDVTGAGATVEATAEGIVFATVAVRRTDQQDFRFVFEFPRAGT